MMNILTRDGEYNIIRSAKRTNAYFIIRKYTRINKKSYTYTVTCYKRAAASAICRAEYALYTVRNTLYIL